MYQKIENDLNLIICIIFKSGNEEKTAIIHKENNSKYKRS